jgi:hypothetical protein
MKPKSLPPYELVAYFIEYDSISGQGTWKVSPANNIKAGSSVGTLYRGYLVVRFKGKSYPAHRLFWLLQTGSEPTGLIDHIDTDRTNNAFSNLRLATSSQNAMNRGATKANKIGVKGVCWDAKAKKYKASIRINGKAKHLGYFDTIHEAANVRRLHEQQIFGSFAFTA